MINSTKAKAIVAALITFVIAVVGGGVSAGLIVGATAAWCMIVVGALTTLLTSLGVYLQANAPAKPNDAGNADLLLLTFALVLLLSVGMILLLTGTLPK